MDRRRDRRTDRASYKDARTHLKTCLCERTSERTSEWPSTCVPITVSSKPPWHVPHYSLCLRALLRSFALSLPEGSASSRIHLQREPVRPYVRPSVHPPYADAYTANYYNSRYDSKTKSINPKKRWKSEKIIENPKSCEIF